MVPCEIWFRERHHVTHGPRSPDPRGIFGRFIFPPPRKKPQLASSSPHPARSSQMRVPRTLNSAFQFPNIHTQTRVFCRFNSIGPLTSIKEQRGRKLTPWLRAMKEIRQRGENPTSMPPRAELTPKRMSESYYSIKLPFSTNEVPFPWANRIGPAASRFCAH